MSHHLDQIRAKLERQWLMCRRGVALCERSPAAKAWTIGWLATQSDPWSQFWTELLNGRREEEARVLREAPYPETGEWRQRITSSPFGILLRKTS